VLVGRLNLLKLFEKIINYNFMSSLQFVMIDIPKTLPRAASDFRLEAPNADETQRPDQAESGAKSDSDHHDDEEEDSPEVYVHHLHPMSQEDPVTCQSFLPAPKPLAKLDTPT